MYLKDGWVLEIGDYYIHNLSFNDLGYVNLSLCNNIEEAIVFKDKEIERMNDMLLSLNICTKRVEIEMYGPPKSIAMVS